MASGKHTSEQVRLQDSGPRHVNCSGVGRGGRSRRHLSQLEKQDGGDVWELTEASPQYWAKYWMQWMQKEIPPTSHSPYPPSPAQVLSLSHILAEMGVAAKNAPSCASPYPYWVPVKAPVEGMLEGLGWPHGWVHSSVLSESPVAPPPPTHPVLLKM